MANVGKASKFSMLRMEDDSDSEFQAASSQSKKKGASKPVAKPVVHRMPLVRSASPNAVHLDDGLVVHAVGKKTKKGAKNKAKVVDEETGFVVQDAPDNYNEDKRYQQQLKEALRESEQIQCEKENEMRMNPEDVTVAQIAKELKTANMGTSSIRDKMVELQGISHVARVEANDARAQMEDYKRRYRKVVSILFEAEVQERADLAKKLVTSRQVEKDLCEQITELRADLEKARTKITELEARLN
ncbi:hypothetical protein PFISCL1PPCAC_20469, partial [Pristionchus fissidentatus]